MVTSPLEVLDRRERARVRASRPEFVAPMRATLVHEPFSDPDWVFERELVEALDAQAQPGLVADGEVVAVDGVQTSFARLQGRLGLTDPERARATGIAVFLCLFDAMVVAGHDVTALPLRIQKRLLTRSVEPGDAIRMSRHRNADGQRCLQEACERGWEGLIAKRADAPYRPGARSGTWAKLTCVRAQELVIGGWTERMIESLRRRFENLDTGSSPFHDRVPERRVHRLRPELVAQIGFSEWTRDGRLRHPRYLGLRDDKDPADVTREEPTR